MKEIIAYRNPAEAYMWHNIMNNSSWFVVMCGMAAFLISFVIIHRIGYLVWGRKFHFGQFGTNACLVVSTIVGIGVIKYMWL